MVVRGDGTLSMLQLLHTIWVLVRRWIRGPSSVVSSEMGRGEGGGSCARMGSSSGSSCGSSSGSDEAMSVGASMVFLPFLVVLVIIFKLDSIMVSVSFEVGSSVAFATTIGVGFSLRNSIGSAMNNKAIQAAAEPTHIGQRRRLSTFGFPLSVCIIRSSSSWRRRLASTVRLAANSSCNSLSSMAHCF